MANAETKRVVSVESGSNVVDADVRKEVSLTQSCRNGSSLPELNSELNSTSPSSRRSRTESEGSLRSQTAGDNPVETGGSPGGEDDAQLNNLTGGEDGFVVNGAEMSEPEREDAPEVSLPE